jgi:hypothetical protein
MMPSLFKESSRHRTSNGPERVGAHRFATHLSGYDYGSRLRQMALMRFLSSDAAIPVIKQKGMYPG